MKLSYAESNHPHRRVRKEFQMPRYERERILREFGVSEEDIKTSIRKINIARRQRESSILAQRSEGLSLATESMKRKMQKIVGVRRSYRIEEELLWHNAEQYGGRNLTKDEENREVCRNFFYF
eukprot:CAMPEP_0194205638 /NCGR_PEP_ID=MMETSP0156-20130528/4863_1 /TAXON_ID=33649 /ORGANISM="Thalassionema nitzschioides, Strain L26-B" /LENGTH=122 /DNA_ID=CAMNT_0038931961 /DNA_START=454 /DNA_END=822 /DNA_ORIENTATION=+